MIGARIKQARLACGLTLEVLAERLTANKQPITKAALSKYELEKSVPKPSLLLAIADLLGVRASYFTEQGQAEVNWIAFRKLAKMTAKHQEQVKAFASHVVENQLWLQSLLFPNQCSDFPAARPAKSLDDAECVACELRHAWRLGDSPIDSLTSRVEDSGGVIVGCREISRGFDGLAGRTNDGFPVAVVSMQVPDDRRRYNLAHELGHLLMECSGIDPKTEEKLANRFASALLVPATAARQELGTKRRRLDVKELAILKLKYGLSMQGWIRRAFDLEIIENSHYTTLCMMFSRNHWKKIEPVSFEGKEEPSRLKLMTLRALAEGVISKERAEMVCPGCTIESEFGSTPKRFSATDLRKMTRDQRATILSGASALAQDLYETDANLTDFDAFGEEDLYGDAPESR
jgi:Zn-dependent peptidase ImmA (M78 family)/transcriptional regulator with XRE-family HTH domain